MRAVNLAGVLDGRILGFAWAKRDAQGAGRRVQGAGTHLLRCWVARAHTRVRAPVRELLQELLQEDCAPKQVTLLNCCAHKRRPVDPSI